ncbi:MAG: clostripain [Anaerovibrio sp.]|uniref:clostripain-related cysteine peptidase n=1 Tax=Anaerovibrio sp. TaxID=1872532 RepID=UPI0025D2ED5C|nr:clostripain-related cysteine peptidase [Anaerovibrio sp.]MCR5177044.1 clostripain [Anaerovibrio sp.]
MLRIFALVRIVVTVILVTLFSCGQISAAEQQDTMNKWTVYWYLCGSDLESLHGAATDDILEMIQGKLPDDVEIVIEAGGSNVWQNNVFEAGTISRYVYCSSGLIEYEKLPDGNMGDKEVLKDFLQLTTKHPAEHKMFVFWDHGGGTLGGVAYDERTQKSLSLNDIKEAFTEVYGNNVQKPPFDIIGFDACLMSTVETGCALQGIAKYMVASEEVEPGTGWNYTEIVNTLANNPDIESVPLGKIICDSYIEGCQAADAADMATLALIDIGRMPQLYEAYDNFGQEALMKTGSSEFFTSFARACSTVENYGGNTSHQGYYDLIDLGGMALATRDLLPASSNRLLTEVNNAVLYKVNGQYRSKGMGLSGYYPFSGKKEYYDIFTGINSASPVFKDLYSKMLVTDAVQLQGLEDVQLLNEDGWAVAQLTPEMMNCISEVRVMLGIADDDHTIYILGDDNNLIADWENGIFKDNFAGTWAALDGYLVYQDVVEVTDDYNIYAIPIKLNGMPCCLKAVYDFKQNSYKILGATREEVNNVAIKDLIKLKAGDEIVTLHYATVDGGDINEIEGAKFNLSDNFELKDVPMGDGKYAFAFEFVTPQNECRFSDVAFFSVQDGEIFLMTDEE